MALDSEQRKTTVFFVGDEVEHSPMFGKRTLFVVGPHTAETVLELAETNNVEHIYLGSQQSFHPVNVYEWAQWDEMIRPLLVKDWFVSLDIDITYAKDLHEQSWCEYHNFIPMLSVKLPNIRLYNYNATLKIDDNSWGDTNPGVWCHPLNELLQRDKFTSWQDYKNDDSVN
jgi:hypothetical protein